jgi:membrane fusion protein (multidrug efflux system)
MPTGFQRTTRSLEADGFRFGGVVVGVAVALLGAWGAWFVGARVPVYEVSRSARLEVSREPHFLDTPMDGQVVSTRLVLGAEVERGQVLVELDDGPERLALLEERARLAALRREREPLDREIATEEEALGEERQAGRARVDEARSLASEAGSLAALASEEARRAQTVHDGGAASASALARARSEEASREAVAAARRAAIARLDLEARVQERGRAARLEHLRRERERSAGEIAALEAAVQRRADRIERHRIRAPVSGTVGEVRPVPVGAFVEAGDRLGTIVPHGDVRIVAQFSPSALGRLRPGQRARLRLEGFPWTEFGAVPASVVAVASDSPRETVRVELAPRRDVGFPVALEHGLPGSAEVEVEISSPATLALRAAGNLMAPSRAAHADMREASR